MSLVDFLTKQVSGVDQDQAAGSAGLIFKLVKEQLGSQDFATLSTVVPESEDLISKAPESGGGGLMGTLGSLAGAMGGESLGNLGKLASLAGGMQKLGLKPEMLSQILPLVLQFVQQQGGDSMKALVEKALKP